MVKLILQRSMRVFRASGIGVLYDSGFTDQQIRALPVQFRPKITYEPMGDEVRYYINFDTEEEAALFKLEYM